MAWGWSGACHGPGPTTPSLLCGPVALACKPSRRAGAQTLVVRLRKLAIAAPPWSAARPWIGYRISGSDSRKVLP
jgi:hypothetical protein